MARPTKQGIDYFPLWNPHFRTEEKFWGDGQLAYKALRSSSSSFIKNESVRDQIKDKCNGACIICGSKTNLQIDHVITVYQAFKDKRYIRILNGYSNLQLLCGKCNASKKPEGKATDG